MKHTLSKTISLVAVSALLLTQLLPLHALPTSADISAMGEADESNYTPDRVGRAPVGGSGDNRGYNAFTFPTFNNYVSLNNLEANRILVRNNSFNDITGLSDFIGDERQFLSARIDLTTSTADDDDIGPGDRLLQPAYDPLLVNASTNSFNSTNTVTNKQVRFYLFVHNNGAPPNSPNGGVESVRALDTTVRVQLPQTFEAAPEVTGYISASNAQYYPDMSAPNDTITNQNLLDTRTISDSVVVHMTSTGLWTGTEQRILLDPVDDSIQFYEHNTTVVPDTNEYDFNEPRDLSAGSASFFNPTGTDPLRGMSLSSSQNGTVLSDGTIIGCFQNAGILTFLANIQIEDEVPTAPTIQKYVSTIARAPGAMTLETVNTNFQDADTAGAAVDFGTQETGSDYTAHYRVAVTNTSDTDLTDVVIVDTMHLLSGTAQTAPRVVNYGTSTPITAGTSVHSYLVASGSENQISDPAQEVEYISSNATSSTFNIPSLDGNQTVVFYYEALIINPVADTETHYNVARIASCDDDPDGEICGLDSQVDAAFLRAHAEPLIPEVDVEKYITNSSTTVDADALVHSIATNNSVNRTNINVYQDADTSSAALEFLTDSTTVTSFDANYLVKLQKTPNSTVASRIADIELSDRFYANQIAYDASGASLPNLVGTSIETYYKVSSKETIPRYFVVQLDTDSTADPYRIISNTDGAALTFTTPADVELGSNIPLTNAMIARVATSTGPIALGTSTNDTQVLFDGSTFTVEEILFSYHVTVPAPSTTARQNSFNRISIDSFATFTNANDTTSEDTDVKESDLIVANCSSANFCDDAHLFTQPKGQPNIDKSVSLTPRATGENGAESFQPADTQGAAVDFGIRTSPYITYYRIAITNTGSTTLTGLAIEDEFFLRGTIATTQNVVNSAGTTLVSNTRLPTYTVGAGSGLETAVASAGDRVNYVGVGAISTAIRFEIPTLEPNQTIAFYYNVLVDNTIAGRPATSNHRNESYVCWLPSQNPKICNPGDRDFAFSRDSAGSNDVEITKTVNGVHSVTVANGAALHYVVTTRNTGTTNLTNVQLSDTVASLPNVSGINNIHLIAPGTCATAPGCALANLGTALSAQSFTLIPNQRATLTYDAVGSFTGNGQSAANTNTATVTTNQTDPETATAVVIVTNTIIIEEDLETNFRIRKDASPELVRDGDEVTYTVRVTPRGTNDTIENLNLLITDDINDDGRLTGPGVTFTYIRNTTRITTSEDAECDGEVNDEDGIRCEDVGPDETIRITYRVRVSAPTLRASDIVNIDNTATLRDDTPDVTIRDEDDAVVQVVGISLPPEPLRPVTIDKTVTPREVKRGELAHYTIVITNPNPDAETHRVVDTIGLNNGVVPGQNGGFVRFNPESFQVQGDLYHSGTIGNPEGLTFTIPGNGRVVLTYTATGEPEAGKTDVSVAPNTATLDTGAYSVAFVELPPAGPAGIAMVLGMSTLTAVGVMLRRRKKHS